MCVCDFLEEEEEEVVVVVVVVVVLVVVLHGVGEGEGGHSRASLFCAC